MTMAPPSDGMVMPTRSDAGASVSQISVSMASNWQKKKRLLSRCSGSRQCHAGPVQFVNVLRGFGIELERGEDDKPGLGHELARFFQGRFHLPLLQGRVFLPKEITTRWGIASASDAVLGALAENFACASDVSGGAPETAGEAPALPFVSASACSQRVPESGSTREK